jgi:hypothetical protein
MLLFLIWIALEIRQFRADAVSGCQGTAGQYASGRCRLIHMTNPLLLDDDLNLPIRRTLGLKDVQRQCWEMQRQPLMFWAVR